MGEMLLWVAVGLSLMLNLLALVIVLDMKDQMRK